MEFSFSWRGKEPLLSMLVPKFLQALRIPTTQQYCSLKFSNPLVYFKNVCFLYSQAKQSIMHVKKKSTIDLFPFSSYTVRKSLVYHHAILRHNNHLDYRLHILVFIMDAYILILANYYLSFITFFRIVAEVLLT